MALVKKINEYFTEFLNRDFDSQEERVAAWLEMEQDFSEKFEKKLTKKPKQKREKRKDEPKGPTNAFFFFNKENRESIKAELEKNFEPTEDHPKLKNTDVVKECGVRWNEISKKKEGKKYHELAAKDKERADKELAEYNDIHGEPVKKSRGRKKEEGAPAGASNGYILFCKDHRESVGKGDLKGAALKTELTRLWNKHKKDQDKIYKKYVELADKDKERFKEENKAFKKSKGEDVEEKPKKTKKSKKVTAESDDEEEEKPKEKSKKSKKSKVETDDEEETAPKPAKKDKKPKIVIEEDDDDAAEEADE